MPPDNNGSVGQRQHLFWCPVIGTTEISRHRTEHNCDNKHGALGVASQSPIQACEGKAITYALSFVFSTGLSKVRPLPSNPKPPFPAPPKLAGIEAGTQQSHIFALQLPRGVLNVHQGHVRCPSTPTATSEPDE
jgi:hypothetical protein